MSWFWFLRLVMGILGYAHDYLRRKEIEAENEKRVDSAGSEWDSADPNSVSDDDPDLFSKKTPVRDDREG